MFIFIDILSILWYNNFCTLATESMLSESPKDLPPHEATSVSAPLLWKHFGASTYNSFELSGTGVSLQGRTIIIGNKHLNLIDNIPIDQPVSWLQWWQTDCVIGGTVCLYLGMTGVKITNWRNSILVNYLGNALGTINNVFELTPSEYLNRAGINDKVDTIYNWS